MGGGAAGAPRSRWRTSAPNAASRRGGGHLGRETAVGLHQQHLIRAEFGAEQGEVSGQVGQRREQGDDVGVVDSAPQLRVGGVGELRLVHDSSHP